MGRITGKDGGRPAVYLQVWGDRRFLTDCTGNSGAFGNAVNFDCLVCTLQSAGKRIYQHAGRKTENDPGAAWYLRQRF